MKAVEEWVKRQYEKMQQEEPKIIKRQDENRKNGQIYEITKGNTTIKDWDKFLYSLKKDTNKIMYRFDFDKDKIYLHVKEE